MLPYYYNPFYQPGRNSMNMPQVQPMPIQQPLTEKFPMAEEPEMMMPAAPQPVMPNILPANIGNQPMQPIQPIEDMESMPEEMMPEYMENMQPIENMQPMQPMQNMPYMPNMQLVQPMQNMPNIPYPQYNYMPYMTPAGRQLQPILSNNPAVVRISAFKELTGYPNYGNPSGNADILYTGTRGTWTINIPASIVVPGNQTAQLAIRAILDDTNTPADRYSATITVNGTTVHTGRVPLPHGTPFGQRFTNWVELTFNVRNIRRNNRIVIVNTSRNVPENSWIGIDWMEMRITPR